MLLLKLAKTKIGFKIVLPLKSLKSLISKMSSEKLKRQQNGGKIKFLMELQNLVLIRIVAGNKCTLKYLLNKLAFYRSLILFHHFCTLYGESVKAILKFYPIYLFITNILFYNVGNFSFLHNVREKTEMKKFQTFKIKSDLTLEY